jgi:hypothetical protein
MRTKTPKTLLIAFAALAAGTLAVSAQVYSQNIVGYVNQTLPGVTTDFSVIVNPLVNGTNSADAVLGGALQAGDEIYLWNGSTYISYTYEGGPNGFLTAPEDWLDVNNNQTNPPALNPGEGVFYLNSQGVNETNTYVGSVELTNGIDLYGEAPNGPFNVVGSTPPLAGSLESTNFNLPLQGGDEVYIWTGTTYASYTYEGVAGGGFLNPPDDWFDENNNEVPAPSVVVAQGFFYLNSQGSDEIWDQSLSVQ